ncbi:MAG: MFS transporter [Actinomycetota bacterium]
MGIETLPRPYYRVLGASGLSNLADGIRMAAFPLLAASLTDDAMLVAAVFVAGEAPWVVLGFWAGKLADQVDRRRLISRVTIARTLLLFALAALVLADAASLWLVALAAFVLGGAEVLADSATGTLVPSIVAPDQLERANSRMVAAHIVGNELVGPAIGGLLFAVGASLPLFTNGSLLAVALVLLAGLPLIEPVPPDADPEPARPQALDGIPFVRNNRILRTITWSSSVLAAVDAAWFALLVLFVRDQLGLGPAGFGLSLAVGAVGGLAGAAIADHRPHRPLATVALVVFGSTAISLIALGLTPTLAVTLVTLVTTSAAFAIWNVHMVSTRQRVTPNHLLGRVGATYRTAVVTASMVGALVGGLVADLTSLRGAIVGYGLVLLVAGPLAVAGFSAAARRSTP